jgi:glycosyltransferase involved in cell wall biosynthesis
MGYANSKLRFLRNCFTNLFIPYFTSNCQAIKEQLMKKEIVPGKKINVIHNPINQIRIDQGSIKPISRKSLAISNSELTVGIVANIRPIKDFETFFSAMAIVEKEVPNSKFIVVGSRDEKYWNSISHLLENNRLRSRVIFTGPLENPIPVMRLFDVGVLTSKSEGLSNSLIEYGAVGIPSVATDVGGNSEIISEGRTGYLVPPGSSHQLAERIIELLKDDQRRSIFGENASEHVTEKFNPDIILQQYEEFHRTVLIS